MADLRPGRPLHGGRGLKQQPNTMNPPDSKSPPSRGARIETPPREMDESEKGRPLHGGRGLKLDGRRRYP